MKIRLPKFMYCIHFLKAGSIWSTGVGYEFKSTEEGSEFMDFHLCFMLYTFVM